MITYLIELDKKVPLKELHEHGLISWKVLRDRDVFLQYDIHIKMNKTRMDAFRETAEMFRMSVRNVIRIVMEMKDDRESNTH